MSGRAAVRSDTIVAAATAPGRAAIGIVRISGAHADEIASRCVAPWPPEPRVASRGTMRDANGDALDDVLVTRFPAPRSYTGETVVEVSLHGSPYIIERAVAAFVAAGARHALPGEFTERAVHLGKLDLLRAEAINDLIAARTAAAHRAALDGLSGTTLRVAESLRRDLIRLDALLAYDIDFPEEDAGAPPRERVLLAATEIAARLDTLLATVPNAAMRRDGAIVVLAGPPNAGKSSLFNALVGQARAIVSDEPGTTRDAIEALIDDQPWPWRLVDTAGLRRDPGAVEQLGIEVGRRFVSNAAVIVACAETAAGLERVVADVTGASPAEILRVRTKGDRRRTGDPATGAIQVSTVSGEGLDALRGAIRAAVAKTAGEFDPSGGAVSTARQRRAIELAASEIGEFIRAWQANALPVPVVATHPRAAIHALDEFIGVVAPDDVLDEVFRAFCVGK